VRLSRANELPEEAFYALFREKVPADAEVRVRGLPCAEEAHRARGWVSSESAPVRAREYEGEL
jgi:hypothetical protein